MSCAASPASVRELDGCTGFVVSVLPIQIYKTITNNVSRGGVDTYVVELFRYDSVGAAKCSHPSVAYFRANGSTFARETLILTQSLEYHRILFEKQQL